MHIVIFAGGNSTHTKLSKKVLKNADAIIAADGGAISSLTIGLTPKAVIGDFDSLPKSFQKKLFKKGVEFIRFKEEKDETDTELAIEYAKKLGATKITILAGLAGNRIDHIMATLLLGSISSVPIEFIQGNQHVLVVEGPTTVSLLGKKGNLLSLIPLMKDVSGITTKNLYYPLQNGKLLYGKPRGVSNVFTKSNIEIFFKKGSLMIVHTTA